MLLNDVIYNIKNSERVEDTYHCPFCSSTSNKKKLSINNTSHNWHCWVCNVKGRSITSLYFQLKVKNNDILQIVKKIDSSIGIKFDFDKNKNKQNSITLPGGFFSLVGNNVTKKLFGRTALIEYLISRNIFMDDIERFNIGATNNSQHENRIIIPSYDETENLNYYISRDYTDNSTLKYNNPKIKKNENIIFENLIDFNYPVTIVEGVFDAITLRYNTIPLLGKFLDKNSKLFNKLIEFKPDVNIFLDSDAFKDSIKIAELLYTYGLNVTLVKSYMIKNDLDINDIGYSESWKMINEGIDIDRSELFRLKIKFPNKIKKINRRW